MADISYFQNEDLVQTDETFEEKDDEETISDEENSEHYSNWGNGRGSGDETGGEQLSSLAKLQQHATSQTVFNRQLVGRLLVDIFRNAVDTGSQLPVNEIMAPVEQVVVDPDASVRSELVEQLPHVAMICQEASDRFGHVLPQHLLGIVIKYLQDDDNQVRKTAQAALLVLMERGLLEKDAIEQLICPVVLHLSYVNDPSVEIHTGAIALMCKMAPLVGQELTERLFLDRFVKLCSEEIFYVRKVCAANLADFCAAVSQESIDKILLPKFVELCLDDVWGVRKACAEAIMSVSCFVSLHQRQVTLAQPFAALLGDTSKWVRMSAFQTLGPFISTFAKQFTGLAYNQYGEVVFTDQMGTELRYNKLSYSNPRTLNFGETFITGRLKQYEDVAAEEMYRQKSDEEVFSTFLSQRRPLFKRLEIGENKCENEAAESSDADDVNKFNPFLYYYISPEMPLDLDLDEAGKSAEESEESEQSPKEEELAKESKEEPEVGSREEETDATTEKKSGDDTEKSSEKVPETLNDTVDVSNVSSEASTPPAPSNVAIVTPTRRETYQCIVPQVLIDYFVSMADPVQVVTTDAEIPHYCAFSFPAVVLTLGKNNWPLLKDAYLSLASAVPWKVRRTLASSIHEVAMILGEDLTARDLVPIYDGFIKDLDEVRIGALKHLATFLRVLRPVERRQYLPRLNNFMITDNEWNWRFREELGNQLLEAVTLYSPSEVGKYIIPLSIHLLGDKIAAVRTVALALVTQIVAHLSANEARVATFVRQLRDVLPRSVIWSCRQTYANLCSRLITDSAISAERFSQEMLPRLIDLSQDPVPNVRLAVARTLAKHVVTRGPEWQRGHVNLVRTRLQNLMQDTDRDVREHAALIRTQ